MAFLSQIMGRTVTDVDGVHVGVLKDLIARSWTKFTHPMVEALVVKGKDGERCIPYFSVATLFTPSIPLKVRIDEVPPYEPDEQDIYLVRDVLDKQIIDTDGARVVRVNDLELLRVNGSVVVSNVDISGIGILRRAGLNSLAQGMTSLLNIKPAKSSISWDNMELLRYDQSMRLKVPKERIRDLHPADIAEILSDMNRLESGQFLESLDVAQLADTLEEVEPDFQASLIERMSDERVADVLEEMEPDEAADLLAELPEERSRGLLELMERDEAEDVRRLLAYPEESAGGIMTTEYAGVRSDFTAQQAIEYLRENGSEAETIFYVYVTDAEDHLEGVFSLSNLIFAPPDKPIRDIMTKRVVSVNLLDDQDEVAQIISKYDLLAVPVVDEDNRLQGIVTADDALDKIIPTAWKKRLPRFYR